MSTHQAAIELAQLGKYVFPVHWIEGNKCSCGKEGCGSPGKHPLTKEGLKNATNDIERIEEWYRRWPAANLALVTGGLSNLVVLDLDGDEAREVLEALGHRIPDTPIVYTARGSHCYFRHPGDRIGNRANLFQQSPSHKTGIDLRGDGGYVIVPPSTHISGTAYCWDCEANLDDMAVADMPDWLVAHLFAGVSGVSHKPLDPTERIPIGSRNDTLFRHASLCRRYGWSADEIYEFIKRIYETKCDKESGNEISDDELRTIAQSTMRYSPSERVHATPRQNVDHDKSDAPTEKPVISVSDDALEYIRRATGISGLQKILKRGREHPQYELIIEHEGTEHNITIGKTLDILNPAKVFAAVWEKVEIPEMKRLKADSTWNEVVSSMRLCVEEIETTSEEEQLETYIDYMLDDMANQYQMIKGDAKSREEAVSALRLGEGVVFDEEGYLYLTVNDLRKVMKHAFSIPREPENVGRMLSKAGWNKTRLKTSTGKRVYCWVSPKPKKGVD